MSDKIQTIPKAERSTVAVQAIATVLIANSHLEAYYPWSWMAADGLLGNSLFFFLAGLGLSRSWLRQPRSFGDFYLRRLLRIYPSLWCVCLIFDLGLLRAWHTWSVGEYFWRFLFPGDYNFIQVILVICVPFYLLLKIRKPKALEICFYFFLLGFTILALNVVRTVELSRLPLGSLDTKMWWVFFFVVMLLGGLCGLRPDWEKSVSFRRSAIGFGVGFAVYVVAKFAMVKGIKLPGGMSSANFFIILLLLTLVMVLMLVQAVVSPEFQKWLAAHPWIHQATVILGELTLEIYLVHAFLAHWERLAAVRFPFNLVLFAIGTLILSWVVYRLANRLRKMLKIAIMRSV